MGRANVYWGRDVSKGPEDRVKRWSICVSDLDPAGTEAVMAKPEPLVCPECEAEIPRAAFLPTYRTGDLIFWRSECATCKAVLTIFND